MYPLYPLNEASTEDLQCKPSELCKLCKVVRLLVTRAIFIHRLYKYGEVILYDTKSI